MPITTLLGLSFGVFPCLLFGFIMLLSLLMCDYIEEYVAKHLCAWKNRRRRGLRSVYRDFRDRGSSNSNAINNNREGPPFRARTFPVPTRSTNAPLSWGEEHTDDSLALLASYGEALPTAPPPGERRPYYAYGVQAGDSGVVNDPPPSYEECVLPRIRQNNLNSSHNSSNNETTLESSKRGSKSSKKSSRKTSASSDKD